MVLCVLVDNPEVMTSQDTREVSIVSLAQNVTIVEGDEMHCTQYGGSSADYMEERFRGYSCGTNLIENRLSLVIGLGAGSSWLNLQSVALEDG